MPKPSSSSLTRTVLNVRLDGDDACWHHVHGVIPRPDGWVFVPSGNPGLTRSLKSREHWVVQERSRTKTGRRGKPQNIGLLVPEPSLKAVPGKSRSAASNVRAKRRRQERDIEELEGAIYKFLKFRRPHMKLARTIASDAAKDSARIGSGGVGRTRTMTLAERAELCARAHIRHQYTNYEDQIAQNRKKGAKRMSTTSAKYKSIKAEAHRNVDAFLSEHRSP